MRLALVLMSILFSFIALNFYPHPKFFPPADDPFALSFYTHDGIQISLKNGSLKLALSPYTLYKNLPHQKTENFTINSYGFRGGEISKTNHSGLGRIIIIGGSAAFGQGVNDQDTIASILQRMLPENQVINGGVVGFLSGQELTYLVTELVDFHPQVVLAYDGWNDLFDVWRVPRNPAEFNSASQFFQIEKRLVENFQTQVSIKAGLRRFLSACLNKIPALRKLSRANQTHKLRRLPTSNIESIASLGKVAENYTNNLKKMNDFCRAKGIRFLVAFQPELGLKTRKTDAEVQAFLKWGNYSEEFPKIYRLFIEEVKKDLDQTGIEYLDLASFPEIRDNSNELFLDPVHTAANGNEIIAKLIYNALVQKPLVIDS